MAMGDQLSCSLMISQPAFGFELKLYVYACFGNCNRELELKISDQTCWRLSLYTKHRCRADDKDASCPRKIEGARHCCVCLMKGRLD